MQFCGASPRQTAISRVQQFANAVCPFFLSGSLLQRLIPDKVVAYSKTESKPLVFQPGWRSDIKPRMIIRLSCAENLFAQNANFGGSSEKTRHQFVTKNRLFWGCFGDCENGEARQLKGCTGFTSNLTR